MTLITSYLRLKKFLIKETQLQHKPNLKESKMKRIVNIIIIILLASGVIFLFVFANQKQNEIHCKEFVINIDYNNAPQLITKSTIKRQITDAGIRVKGEHIATIKAKKLQKILSNNPYIKRATISVGVNGIVTANILQRKPLVRVIDQESNQCLIDHDGYRMPVNPDFPVRLVLASGNVRNLKQNILDTVRNESGRGYTVIKTLPSDLNKIHKIALKLEKDTLTSALIEQIYFNDKREIELVPKMGDQSIILGDTVSLDEKLKNLHVFYSKGMKNFAWNNYKVINLKYKNQVVCSK